MVASDIRRGEKPKRERERSLRGQVVGEQATGGILYLPSGLLSFPFSPLSIVTENRWRKRRLEVMGVLSNVISREELKPGDHIYSWRTAYIYAHHGIYIGDDMVIHFTRAAGQEAGTGTFLDKLFLSSSPTPNGTICERCGDQSKLHGVIKSCIDCFLAGGNLYIFEYAVSPVFFIAKARGGTCTLAAPDPAEHALHRAKSLLDKGFGTYNLFKNNCEDFAIYCKTGLLIETTYSIGRSGQLASWSAFASTVMSSPLRYLTTSGPGLVLVAGTVYSLGRYVADIGIRRDVIKIPVETLIIEANAEEPQRASGLLTI